MKILDRYVVSMFLKNYLISLFVLIGMYVSLDMVFNFDELVQVQEKTSAQGGLQSALTVIKAAGSYYFYQIFYIFVQMAGMIPVVAAGFTLIRLSRFNELSAILSSGVPLLRVAFPIIVVGIILNVLMLADQELLIPNIIPKLVRSRQEAGLETTAKTFQIPAMQDDKQAVLNVARYSPGPGDPIMYEFTLVERNEKLQPKSMVIAKRAQWEPESKSWKLFEGKRITGLLPSEERKVEENVTTYQSVISPEEILLYRSGNYVDMLSTARIDDLLDRPQSYGTIALLRVRHARFTQPIVNIIILLLAIPCVLMRQPSKLKSASTKCLGLVTACMGMTFISAQMAGYPPNAEWAAKWPAIMAWMPILIFGPIAVFLLDRVET